MANATEIREAVATLDLINEAYNDWVDNGSRGIDASAALETIGQAVIDYYGTEDDEDESEEPDEDEGE